jgi:hypothetical protein
MRMGADRPHWDKRHRPVSFDVPCGRRRWSLLLAKALLELSCRVQGRTIRRYADKNDFHNALRVRADQLDTYRMIHDIELVLEGRKEDTRRDGEY